LLATIGNMVDHLTCCRINNRKTFPTLDFGPGPVDQHIRAPFIPINHKLSSDTCAAKTLIAQAFKLFTDGIYENHKPAFGPDSVDFCQSWILPNQGGIAAMTKAVLAGT
jgi:hypothetical protein